MIKCFLKLATDKCQIYFMMVTQPTEYIPPLLDMRENPDGINGLNLVEMKQMAFQQQDERFEKWVAASFANELEKYINVLGFSDLPPLPDSNGRMTQESTLEMQAVEDNLISNSAKRQMNEHTCKFRQILKTT